MLHDLLEEFLDILELLWMIIGRAFMENLFEGHRLERDALCVRADRILRFFELNGRSWWEGWAYLR